MSTVVRPPAPQEDQPRISSPYRGLMPYREEDADYFFGRTAYIELVSANLVASRLTVLYAPSGVGKSSLLLAGVVHQMREMARGAVRDHQPPGYVPVVVRRWSGDPIAEIEAAVADALRAVLGDESKPGESDLPGLAGVFDGAAKASGSKVYAVFDQFEEMLLYHGDDWDDDDGPAPELARLMRADEIRANFLIAIRQDSLAELDSFKGRVPGLLDKRVRLPHLDRTAGREAIEQPLDRWNRRHRVEEGMSLDPELIEAVLDQVTTGAIALDRAGGGGTPQASGSIEAPFLQLVMERIWEVEREAGSDRMQRSTLDGLGGATEIVRTHLDRQMQLLSDEEQDVAAAVFHRLVTPSGAKVALRASDLAAWTGIGRDALERVLGELAQSDWRVVRAIEDPARPDAPPDLRDLPRRAGRGGARLARPPRRAARGGRARGTGAGGGAPAVAAPPSARAVRGGTRSPSA